MFFHEDTVVKSFEKCDNLVDENDNYNCKYNEQLINVAPSSSDVDDEPPCKIIRIESIPESVFASDESSHETHQQQTLHSKYFSELPTETSTVDLDQDEPEQMVNVPLLLHQLRSSRVVLERLPHKPIDVPVTSALEIHNEVESPAPTCKIGVQRYCQKCKTLDIDHNRVKTAKLCSKCSTALFYLCDKCNVNRYHIYGSFARHRRQCEGRGKIVPMVDYQLRYLVKRNDIDYSIARKRYCPTCAKTIENHSANEAEICQFCNTILLYQCGNCNHRCSRYGAFDYHLKTKCYPSVYRCPECQYTASIWYAMNRHLKKRRCSRFLCMSLKKKFACEHCSFGYDYKWNLKNHQKKIHKELFV